MNPVAFDYVDLDSAAKVIKDFENPTLEGEEIDTRRYRTSTEIDAMYPNWLDGTTTESGKHSTQVEVTRKTYGKVGDWIEANLGKDVSILDASSGMGYGIRDLRERGFDIEDVEHNAGVARAFGPVKAHQANLLLAGITWTVIDATNKSIAALASSVFRRRLAATITATSLTRQRLQTTFFARIKQLHARSIRFFNALEQFFARNLAYSRICIYICSPMRQVNDPSSRLHFDTRLFGVEYFYFFV